jgi:hypothetical protein
VAEERHSAAVSADPPGDSEGEEPAFPAADALAAAEEARPPAVVVAVAELVDSAAGCSQGAEAQHLDADWAVAVQNPACSGAEVGSVAVADWAAAVVDC